MSDLRRSVAWPPQFDPWVATERVREMRDRAQALADAVPVPSRDLTAFIDYCDGQIAAAFRPVGASAHRTPSRGQA